MGQLRDAFKNAARPGSIREWIRPPAAGEGFTVGYCPEALLVETARRDL